MFARPGSKPMRRLSIKLLESVAPQVAQKRPWNLARAVFRAKFVRAHVRSRMEWEETGGAYKRLELLRRARTLEAATPEQKYWRRFKTVAVHKAYAPVHCVAFAPAAPFDFCTTNSTRVQIYGNKGKTLRRTISRFKDVVYTAAFRGDGKLLVAGGEEKDLKVFDTGTGGMLRMLKGHTRAVHTCHFADDKVHLMSGGDDAVVRFWDVSSVRAFA